MIKHLPRIITVSAISFVLSTYIFSKTSLAASLSFTPESGSFNSTFDVTINVDPQGASVSGVDAIIKYEPDKLEAQLIQNGSFEQYLKKNINKTTGTIEISSYNTTTQVSAVTTVAKITFKPLSNATTKLSFVFTQGTTPSSTDSAVASGGNDVLSSVKEAIYTLSLSGTTTSNTNPTDNVGVGSTNPGGSSTSGTGTKTSGNVPTTGSTEYLVLFSVISLLSVAVGYSLLKEPAKIN